MIVNVENIALHKYIVQITEAFQKALEIVSQAKAKSYLMISMKFKPAARTAIF